MVPGNLAAPAMSRIEHGAQRPVEGKPEVVGFVDQQGWMLAVNRMVDAGRGYAVRFQGTRTQGLKQVEEVCAIQSDTATNWCGVSSR